MRRFKEIIDGIKNGVAAVGELVDELKTFVRKLAKFAKESIEVFIAVLLALWALMKLWMMMFP